MIKVSIVVPIYNVSEYLRECLDSIVNQTLKDIEIICVNDGSTDNSLEIIKEYSKKDSRIIIIDKPNSGYGHSMNVGIDRATGKYIGIVEPDDYVKLDMYETLYNEAEKNDVNIVKSDFYVFDTINDTKNMTYRKLTNKKEYYNKIIIPSNNIEIFNFIMMNWTGIYKTEFIKSNNIRHNETPGASFQDNGFWFQNFTLTDTIYFIDKAFYYNRRDNPNSSVHNKEKVFCIKHEFDFIRNFLENNIELKNKYIYIYQYRKFHSYLFSYRRIANEYKKTFLKTFSKEFKEALHNNELDKNLFSNSEWDSINLIISNMNKFYRLSLNQKSFFEKYILDVYYEKNIYKIIKIFGFIKITIKETRPDQTRPDQTRPDQLIYATITYIFIIIQNIKNYNLCCKLQHRFFVF